MRALLLIAVVCVCGALGDPFLAQEIPFESVRRMHFDALGVVREATDAPAAGLLTVRVLLLGDAADADLDEATAWLREHAGIALVSDAKGAPLFLTRGDLAATSGRGTLGATVPAGMAVEVSDPRIAPCVIAHEALHFVGLKHVDDRANIMYAHCSKDFLARAELLDWQREFVDKVSGIRATTPGGVELWASR